jgi:hypothetical protein
MMGASVSRNDELRRQALAKELKQFTRHDLATMLANIIPAIVTVREDVFIDNLHREKYHRLVNTWNKKVDIYNARYKHYAMKQLPKNMQVEFNAFFNAFKKLEKHVEAQKKIMLERGLIKEEKESGT